MSTFNARVTPTSAALDPLKHVNYNLGMVLGVDDFTQEFSYLSGHDHWLARDLLGYGTVSGLRVLTETDSKGPRVVVEPGVALSPLGQLIRVPAAQCAYLNDWLKLDTTKRELLARVVSPPSTVRVYVVLCYRECPSDKVPIPGEPCRSEDDVILPSRLMDDFRLELMLDPPGQREEDAVRDFVAWLSQVTVSESSASSSLDDFLNALRAAARVLTSPPEAGSGPLADYMFDSPPASLVINDADLCGYLDAAFRLWVTELRPKWRPDFFGGAHPSSIDKDSPIARTEECLLLAEVDVPAIIPTGGVDWQVGDPALIRVDEERRPIVVHLRMLQEMLLCGKREQFFGSPPAGGGGPFNLGGDVTGSAVSTRAVRLQGVAVDPQAPAEDQVLTFRGGRWLPATSAISPGGNVSDGTVFGAARSAGKSTNFSRADHSHGTPSEAVAGDVTGTFSKTTVAAIRNAPVVGTPADGQVLTFRNNQWQAETPAAGGTGDFVEHPRGLAPYSIVAAGIVKCDGTVRRPVYGNLSATATAPSLVTVKFEKLEVPNGKFQYIVKAMPVSSDLVGIVWVSFGTFVKVGELTLKVERLNFQNIKVFTIPIDELKLMELMIEVSRFEIG